MARQQLHSIALARTADAAAIACMSRDLIEQGLNWSWREARVRRAILHRDCCTIVIRQDCGLAAFAIMYFGDETAHLNLLAVAPRSRRQGIARALLEWLRTSAQVAGIKRIDLELRADNHGARTFYEQLGFSVHSIAENYYQGRESALRMTSAL